MSSALLRSLKFVRDYLLWAVLGVAAVLASAAADLVSPQILRRIIDEGIAKADYRGHLHRGGDGSSGVAVARWHRELPAGVPLGQGEPRLGVPDAQRDLRQAAAAELRLPRPRADRPAHHARDLRRRPGARLRGRRARAGRLRGPDARGRRRAAVPDERALAALSMLVVPATIFVLVAFVRRLGPMFRARQQKLAALNTVLQENVAGVRVVRAFAREAFEIERYRARQRRPARAGARGAPHGRQRLPAHVQRRHDRRWRRHGRRAPRRSSAARSPSASSSPSPATSSCCSARS